MGPYIEDPLPNQPDVYILLAHLAGIIYLIMREFTVCVLKKLFDYIFKFLLNTHSALTQRLGQTQIHNHKQTHTESI